MAQGHIGVELFLCLVGVQSTGMWAELNFVATWLGMLLHMLPDTKQSNIVRQFVI